MGKNLSKSIQKIKISKRKRYKLSELLQNATAKNLKALNGVAEWAQKSKPTGRELV